MKKLKNKTFIVLLVILTTFLLTLLVIFNTFLYNNHYKIAQDKLERISRMPDKINPFLENDSSPMFIDSEIYIISFDNRYNIKKVINFSNDGKTESEIINLVNEDFKYDKANNIENLYTNKYIYCMNNKYELIVINNVSANSRLVMSLELSILLFVLTEIVIIYISVFLTKWLTKPVKETFDKQKQFVCDASHELKTPLSVILASAETLDQDKNNQKWINNIKEEAERMNKLVIDLLDLAKTEDLNETEILEEVNLSKIIEKATLKFESLAFENNLEIEYDIESDINFKCQSERIKQLLGILLDNAIKHSLENSKIKVILNKEKEEIILKVINRGEPIPNEERELIFERFYRSDKSRTRINNRYGLGLAIAKNIVINHNGNIKVECQNGYTTFIVNLKKQ